MSFTNQNICASFNQSISTTLQSLSSQICSEVIICNKSNVGVRIFDNNQFDTSRSFILSGGDEFTFRGITNSNQLSAQTVAGTTLLSYRTQFYSQNILR